MDLELNMDQNKMEQKRIESEDKIKKLCDYVAQTQNEIFDEMVFEEHRQAAAARAP